MGIDYERLREDMKQDSLGAFFAGEFGGAIAEERSIERATHEELERIAESKGIKMQNYLEP